MTSCGVPPVAGTRKLLSRLLSRILPGGIHSPAFIDGGNSQITWYDPPPGPVLRRLPRMCANSDNPSGDQKMLWTPSLPGSARDSSPARSRMKIR